MHVSSTSPCLVVEVSQEGCRAACWPCTYGLLTVGHRRFPSCIGKLSFSPCGQWRPEGSKVPLSKLKSEYFLKIISEESLKGFSSLSVLRPAVSTGYSLSPHLLCSSLCFTLLVSGWDPSSASSTFTP